MSTSTEVVTVMTCDRCKTNDASSPGAFANGGVNLQYTIWQRGHDGAAGGATLSADLCECCSKAFHDFMVKP